MYNWTIVEDANESDLAVLSEGVIRFGRSLAADGHARPIACFGRDGDKIIAGASGRTEYNRLFISYLWVEENLRSQGIGSKILAELEKAARERGSVDALLETLDERAVKLYSRLGYRHVAKIPNYVGPFTKHIMIKSLKRVSGA